MKANKAKIIDLMCEKNLTQAQLARGCGARNSTITAILMVFGKEYQTDGSG